MYIYRSLLQDVPGLVTAYDANPSVLTARRSAPKRATKAPAQPLRRSRRGRAAVHALWTPLGRPSRAGWSENFKLLLCLAGH